MIKRNWFIFHGDHHIGPFSLDEIMTKVVIMELTRDDLIWKEGHPSWLAVHKWPEFTSLFPEAFSENSNEAEAVKVGPHLVFEAPFVEEVDEIEPEVHETFEELEGADFFDLPDLPDLPPLPPMPPAAAVEEFASDELQFVAPPSLSETLTDLPPDQLPELPPELPPLPPVPTSDLETYVKDKEYDEGAGDEDKYDFDYTRSQGDVSFQLSHLRFYVSIAIGLIGLIVFVSYLWGALNSTPRAFGLSKGNRDAIIHVTQQPFKKNILYKIRPTTDLSSLWLGSNYPRKGWAILRLHTLVGRFMGKAPVELLAQGPYTDGLTFFDEIEIVTGEGIAAGEYDYTLELIPGGKVLRWNMFLKKIPVIRTLLPTEEPLGKQILKGRLLLSNLPLKEFNSQLDNYHRSLNQNLLLPLKEQRQRYQTFLGLLEQMDDLYDKTINRITKGRSIYLFEEQYNRQIGPMLRDLIIDGNKRHLSYLNINPELSEGYLVLTDFGKEVGELASYMVTETRKVKHLDKKSSIMIKTKMKKKVDGLLKKGLNHINEINLQLKNFK